LRDKRGDAGRTLVRDITQPKRAEESVSRFAATVERSDDAIIAIPDANHLWSFREVRRLILTM
jgi:hypothetical protein